MVLHAGKEDGIFGPRTDRGVREFQRNVASHVDGIVGLDTVHAISRYRPPVDAPSRAVVREGEAARGTRLALPRAPPPPGPRSTLRAAPWCARARRRADPGWRSPARPSHSTPTASTPTSS